MIPFFNRIQIPAYLGCDWENVPLHLPGSLAVIEVLLAGNPDVRVALLGDRGISWRARHRRRDAEPGNMVSCAHLDRPA